VVKTREETALENSHQLKKERRQTFGIGLLKGMGVTLKHLFKRNTVIQYPDEKQDLAPRTRGVIALKEENCTVCMLCARECPDWCIYIDSHKETLPPKREGGRPRKRNVLDRFAIDYALCMYCGICVEVCPYDALFWSREFEYAEYDIRELTHEKERLSDWMATVLPPPPLEEGAEIAGQPAAAVTPTVEASGARAATVSSSAAEARTEQAQTAPKAGTVAPTDSRPTDTLPAKEQKAETESVPEPAPAAMAPETKERGEPGVPAPEAQIPPKPAEAPADADVKPEATVEQTTPEAATEQRSSTSASSPESKTQPPAEPAEDPQAVYDRVLAEQQAKGSSPQVAEARAKVARVKAERGVRAQAAPAPTPAPQPSAPTQGRPTEPEPSGAPEATTHTPDPGPVAPAADEGAGGGSSTEASAGAPAAEGGAGDEDREGGGSAPATPSPESPSEASSAPASPAGGEDPELAYQRVLREERDKGSSEAVAMARAKAARVRAQKGTKGPGGAS
jgi:formate hydrogenlyase subunit 6/NADH:ubiquinone oxidoreductase subunit I